jgi:hypothetical protein
MGQGRDLLSERSCLALLGGSDETVYAEEEKNINQEDNPSIPKTTPRG